MNYILETFLGLLMLAYVFIATIVGPVIGNFFTYTEAEYISIVDNAVAMAVESNSTLACEELPDDIRHEWNVYDRPAGIQKSNPQKACLSDYYYISNDTRACELLMDLDKQSGDRCYLYLAEAKQDPSLCDKMSYENRACKIYAKRVWERCLGEDVEDSSSSRNQGGISCIRNFVGLTKDYTGCLEIDGPDWGEEWARERNQCLWDAMLATAPIGIDNRNYDVARIKQWLCEYMVNQEDVYGFTTVFGDADLCLKLKECLEREGADTIVPNCQDINLIH